MGRGYADSTKYPTLTQNYLLLGNSMNQHRNHPRLKARIRENALVAEAASVAIVKSSNPHSIRKRQLRHCTRHPFPRCTTSCTILHAPVKQKASSSSATPEQQWSDRHEISNLEPNPLVLDAISNANCIVYGCGSLYTSVLPSLVLEGVGGAISEWNVPKVLLRNGWHDSKTSWVRVSTFNHDSNIIERHNEFANKIIRGMIHEIERLFRLFLGVFKDTVHGCIQSCIVNRIVKSSC